MNQSLTVVLPIHNAESTLRRSVNHVLEVASDLTPDVDLLIVDDGSTDDSFDIAREVAAEFPQVRVMRQPHRRGLGPTIKDIRRRVKSDVVMVHDGVSETNAEQLRALWERRIDPAQPAGATAADLLAPSRNHAAMAQAHRRVMSFQMLSPGSMMQNETTDTPPASTPRPSEAKPNDIGAIPPLPRANLIDTMSDFAFGE